MLIKRGIIYPFYFEREIEKCMGLKSIFEIKNIGYTYKDITNVQYLIKF